MAEGSLIDKLDEIVERILKDPGARREPGAPELEGLARLAADLRELPREEFRARLKSDLERSANMSARRKPAPKSVQTVTPYLVVSGPEQYLDFLKQAFGAEEVLRTTGTAGGLHAEVRMGGSILMVGGGEGINAIPAAIHLYVADADATYRRALAAGASSLYEPVDQEYGDREAGIEDASGNNWYIGTHQGEQAIPVGLRSVTPFLQTRGTDRLIHFLQRAFGAEETLRAESPDGTILHAKIRIGDSVIEAGEAHGRVQPMSSMLYLSVDDADTSYEQALAAGGTSIEEPADQPYGARRAGVKDPCGNSWYMASPLKKSRR